MDISLDDLFNLEDLDSYEIETPDGWVPLVSIWPTGFKEEVFLLTELDKPLVSSKDHPIETQEGFKCAEILSSSDQVLTKKGFIPISSIEKKTSVSLMYDLEVDHPNHRFYADGMSVHNCYGGTEYTLHKPNSLNCSLDEALVAFNNFFSELPDLRNYMMQTRLAIKMTGITKNMFGRIRDVSKFVNSASKRDQSYAERTGLNHPIQSTSADLLKLGTIRCDEMIQLNGYNLLYGRKIPQKIDYKKTSYLQILFSLLASIHDELQFHLAQSKTEEILPTLYETMTLADVIEAFKITMILEQDIEYDEKGRSILMNTRFHAAKAYLLRYLRSKGDSETSGYPTEPNLMVLRMEDLTKSDLELLKSLAEQGAQSDLDKDCYLGVKSGTDLFLYPSKLPRNLLENQVFKYAWDMSPRVSF